MVTVGWIYDTSKSTPKGSPIGIWNHIDASEVRLGLKNQPAWVVLLVAHGLKFSRWGINEVVGC